MSATAYFFIRRQVSTSSPRPTPAHHAASAIDLSSTLPDHYDASEDLYHRSSSDWYMSSPGEAPLHHGGRRWYRATEDAARRNSIGSLPAAAAQPHRAQRSASTLLNVAQEHSRTTSGLPPNVVPGQMDLEASGYQPRLAPSVSSRSQFYHPFSDGRQQSRNNAPNDKAVSEHLVRR